MKEDNLEPFDLERCIAGDKVITRDGREYKFGAHNPLVQDYAQVIGWVDQNVIVTNCKGEYHPITDSQYDLFMAPKVKRWYKHIHSHGTSNNQWDTLKDALNKGAAHHSIGIIEFTKVGNIISVSIVHHYNQGE